MQSLVEVTEDEQALANGYLADVTNGDGSTYLGALAPGQFGDRPPGPLTASPEHGQHTEEVLLGLGLDWDRISALKAERAII